MEFWLIMLGITLGTSLIPLLLGSLFCKHPPKSINSFVGYRTSLSMKNEETWRFAQTTSAALFYKAGKISLAVTLAAMLPVCTRSEAFLSVYILAVFAAQAVAMTLPIIRTGRALKMIFDKDGNRRSKDG